MNNIDERLIDMSEKLKVARREARKRILALALELPEAVYKDINEHYYSAITLSEHEAFRRGYLFAMSNIKKE